MDKLTFDRRIDQNWAGRFGCPVSLLAQSGTTLRANEKHSAQPSLDVWHIGRHAFAEVHPRHLERFELLLRQLPAETALRVDDVARVLGAEQIALRDRTLFHYLYPSDLPDFTPAAPFVLRQLTLDDRDAMQALHDANTPADVNEGYVEVDHLAAFGCFFGEQLVAASSGFELSGFLDLGVLTHPEFRRKGLGRAVVGALCAWSIERDLIAQYRHDDCNIHSARVAAGLKFQYYFDTESVTLNE